MRVWVMVRTLVVLALPVCAHDLEARFKNPPDVGTSETARAR